MKTTERRNCARCGHPKTFHGGGKTSCNAMGCHYGEGGAPCPDFEEKAEEPVSAEQDGNHLASV